MVRSHGSRSAARIACAALLLAASSPADALWMPNGTPVIQAAGDQSQPAAVSDGSGGAIFFWSDSRAGDTDFDIYAQRLSVRGAARWTRSGVPVCRAPADQFRPVAISDGSGGAIVAWADARNGALDVYAQRVDGSSRMQWGEGGIAVCAAPADQYEIAIASDGAGGAILAWQDYRSGAAQRDVFAQRLDASGTALWTRDGVPLQSPSRGGIPSIVADGLGGAIVAWEDSLSLNERDIRAQRLSPEGTPVWAAGGVVVSSASGAQMGPRAISTPNGAIILWSDSRDGLPAVYGQRCDLTGNARWTTQGVQVSSGAERAEEPIGVPSEDGGAVAVWVQLSGGFLQLRAQRVDSLGGAVWTAGGVPVSASPADQLTPAVAPDGWGGAIVTWFDFTPAVGSDIYAQRLDASGSVAWGSVGTPVCTDPSLQSSPSITSDGHGGAILLWQDARNAVDQDLFAARLLPDGATIEIPSSASIGLAAPNPTRSETLLEFGLPAPGYARIRVFDLAGRLVRRLLDEPRPAGIQGVTWDGTDDQGRRAASGVYFVDIQAGEATRRLKITLVR